MSTNAERARRWLTEALLTFRGITWFEFTSGQIVRGWDCWNVGGVMQSLTAAAG